MIHELRQLTNLTQVELVEALGVAYATIDRWQNRYIQVSTLALKPLRALIDELSHSSSKVFRAESQQLLTQYFLKG